MAPGYASFLQELCHSDDDSQISLAQLSMKPTTEVGWRAVSKTSVAEKVAFYWKDYCLTRRTIL